MNFLAHYFFDGVNNAPPYNLGTVLPDLMGMVRRGWKLAYKDLHKPFDPLQQAIAEGVIAHLQMDEWFHKTSFFQAGREKVKLTLLNAGIQFPPHRPGFLAHIMLELLLDRLIIKHYPKVVSNFYQELEQVEMATIRTFFHAAGQPFDEHFPGFFSKFLEKRFVFRYADDQQLLKALNSIGQRVRQPAITGSAFADLASSLPELDLMIFNSFDQLKENAN